MALNLNSHSLRSGILAAPRVQGRETLNWMPTIAVIFTACAVAIAGNAVRLIANVRHRTPLAR